MDYDHGKKAGNQGDVVKHVALAAALRQLLLNWEGSEFKYADTFAAYAWNTFHPNGEWRQGIAKLDASSSVDPDVNWLIDTYGLDDVSAGKKYPGSAKVACDAVHAFQKSPSLSLWDIADKPIASLRAEFDAQSVFQKPATHLDQEVLLADFLFIAPRISRFGKMRFFLCLRTAPRTNQCSFGYQ